MKTRLLILLSFFILNNIQSQANYISVCLNCTTSQYYFDFNTEFDSTSKFIFIDSTQTNNIWQVGKIDKTIFHSGYFDAKALVTDTINPYPINNISTFQFSIVDCLEADCTWGHYGGYFLEIIHEINTDSGQDGGTIEVSYDHGVTWTNIIQDTINLSIYSDSLLYSVNDTVSSLGKPGFSGTKTWEAMEIYPHPNNFMNDLDTMSFRFTFASDSIQTNKDGWLIGRIWVQGEYEGVKEVFSSKLISVFPNPARNELLILPNENYLLKGEITIMDIQGRIVYRDPHFESDNIDISRLNPGLYFLKYTDTNYYSSVKFIKR